MRDRQPTDHECRICNGTGEEDGYSFSEPRTIIKRTCMSCKGRGWIPDDEAYIESLKANADQLRARIAELERYIEALERVHKLSRVLVRDLSKYSPETATIFFLWDAAVSDLEKMRDQ